MKILCFFLTFLISSVAAVTADDREDHSDNKKKLNLRASSGSAAAQGTAFALFDGELETDASLTFDDNSMMTLDEEMKEVLQGMDEVQRSIQLAAYKDFKQKSMSLEEINKKYLPHGDGKLDVGTKTASTPCCRNRFSNRCGFFHFAKMNVSGGMMDLTIYLINVAIQMIEVKKLGFGRIVSKVNEEK